MSPIHNIAVIGATGRLGAPVAEELAKTFNVRAIVRTPEKAKTVLSSKIEIVQGDLHNIAGLHAALEGMDAIYINLSTETVDMSLPFYAEREGVKNLVEASKGIGIKYIGKIGSLGAYPPAIEGITDNVASNQIRIQGHEIIEASGIPCTFFEPTHFMELLPTLVMNGTLQWIGNTDIHIYFISVDDYKLQVAKAFQKYEEMPVQCPIQGPKAYTIHDAMELFVREYDPTLKIRVLPLWVMRVMGIFSPKLRFFAQLFTYFGNHEDAFFADQTWKDLGKPATSLEAFSKNLRKKKQEDDAPL